MHRRYPPRRPCPSRPAGRVPPAPPGLLPFLIAAMVVLAAGIAVAVVGNLARTPDGIALDADDRAELTGPPVLRGADGPPADPSVDRLDPEAVLRAYVAAAYSVRPEDAGHTNRRAVAYTLPGSPPATVGVLVLDPGGTHREAAVQALELVAVDPGDTRRAYLAAIRTTDGPDLLTAHVVLAHQQDGRWLVAADTPENPDLD